LSFSIFCNPLQTLQRQASETLRSFATQVLAANNGLTPYILETFVNHGLRPTKKSLGMILETLITSLPSVRIVVDGLGEYPQSDQDEVIDDPLRIKGIAPGACKILLSSRKVPYLTKILQSKPIVRLDDHVENMDSIIALLVSSRLACLRSKFDADIVGELGRQILAKADGNLLIGIEMTSVLISV